MCDGFPGATKVLDELFGLKIAPLTRRGPLVPMTVAFTLEHLDADWQSQIRRLAERLQVPLCAIGNTGRWSAFLLLAETGFVFELGFAAYGLYLMGTSFGDALRRVLTGEVGVPVEFSSEQDPDGLFRRERSAVDDLCPNLVAIHPTVSSGIRDIQPRFLDDGRYKADRLGDGG
jgi:hypothetical protein